MRGGPPPGIVILIYHSIAESGTAVTVTAQAFREQLLWLRDHYRVVSLDEALAIERLEEDVVVLTFDDGYDDYLTTALPLLSQADLPSTVYVITETVEDPERSFGFAAGRGKAPLTRAHLEELRHHPLVTIGSHTHSHARLPGLAEERLRHELDRSRDLLRDILGVERPHFCYPWGEYDGRADALVRQRFASAVTGTEGKNRLPVDRFALRRIPVKRGSLRRFAKRVDGRLSVERNLRRIRNLLRTTVRGGR